MGSLHKRNFFYYWWITQPWSASLATNFWDNVNGKLQV
ncbi:hypothetical protein Nizo2766_0978 [Lactiplantibacillus plantarum]|nr:hypothetical protein Nizo2766_0978 [Lactiplantibacillus plantarum]